MTKRFIMVLAAFLAIGIQAFAQSTVTGKVTDETGEALVGVNVMIKGTTTGTMTDLDGAYKLAGVKSSSVLVFSSIGYTTQEITAGSQKTINVVLKSDTEFLDDVVVVGYGTARKKDVSGAIASVNYGNDKNIANLPNPNALAALSSRVAGLDYAPTSSASGDNSSSMTIRGKNAIPQSSSTSSQSVNAPLLVVDGVLSYASINSINTSDIESIDVLKDASAAAIYGSRAANGVIIITTKRGTTEKPVVRFDGSVKFSDWARMPKMVTDDETFLKNRFYSKQATGAIDATMQWSDSIDKALLLSTNELEAYEAGNNINWLDEISRTGIGQKYDVNVSGKSKNVSYYVAGNFTNTQGIIKGDNYQKYTFLSKLDINVTKWLTVGIKGNYLGSSSKGVPARVANAIWITPYSWKYSTIEGYENWPNSHPDGGTASPYIGTGSNDSYLYTDKTSHSTSIDGVGYAQIDFPFLPGLSYRFTAQGHKSSGYTDIFNNTGLWVNTWQVSSMSDPSQYNSKAYGSSQMSNSSTWNVDNILTYTKDFGRHHADAMVGYTREAYNYEYLGTSFTGFTVPTTLGVYSQDKVVYDTDAGSTYSISRTRTRSSAIGYLARINYNYASKYYITGNFRRDGYSAFADGHKWGNFFGVSGAWVLSNENFIKQNATWIDFLKLRLSWGQNGSRSVSPYATAATVNSVVANSGSQTSTWLGDQSQLGITATNLPNHNLTWATVEKTDLGIDFSLKEGRINGTIDGYFGNTTNMLMQRSVPYFSGFTSAYDNVGLVTNNGIEFTLNTVNIAGDGQDRLRWETTLVFDHNTNTVKHLYGEDANGEEADDVANAVAYGFDSYYALQVGHPIGSAYDLKKLGIFQSQEEIDNYKSSDGTVIQPDAKPGDLKFEDWNNDGKIDSNDRHFIGSPDPLFTINFANTLSWKGFSLYFNFRWAQGDKTHFLGFDPNSFGTTQTSGAQLAKVKPWTEENHSNTYPRRGYSNTMNYLYWNSRSYLKLKDLSFSYTIPEKITKHVGMSNVRVYVAGTDLFTISNWSGIDPETAGTIANGASSSRYVGENTFKSYTVGINLTF